jgi:hypothetical protein
LIAALDGSDNSKAPARDASDAEGYLRDFAILRG